MLNQVTKAILAALARDDVKKRVTDLGYELVAGGPDVAKSAIAKEVPFFKDLIKDAKIPQVE